MHKVSTIGSLRGFAAAWVLGFGAVAFTLPACSSDDAATEARAAGSIDLALTGVSGSGQTYRLRQGEIAITGTSTAAVSTEDHLDESRVSLELPAGGYLAALAEGWHLERLGADGTWSEIRAVLTSVNPLPFTVVDQGVTDVTLTFRAGDEVVELGNGRIHLGIAVDDGEVPPPPAGTCEEACAGPEAMGCAFPDYCVPICAELPTLVTPECAAYAESYVACAGGVPGEEYLCTAEGYPVAAPCLPLWDEVMTCLTGPCSGDADGDGACVETDCNDNDPTVHPGAPETCGDGIDQNCDGVDATCAPAGWTCEPGYYGVGDGCDCGCGVIDPDCADATVESCQYCGEAGSCSPAGVGCPGNISPTNNAVCAACVDTDGDGYCAEFDCNDADDSVHPGATEVCGDGIDQSCDGVDLACGPAGWTCPANYFGTDDGCDCGCGVLDPDCADATVASCEYCSDPGSCAQGQACPANIDPANNAICAG